MSTPGSVTHWIRNLKAGDAGAAHFLWERYFPRLLGLARKMLRGTSRRTADEEDVALCAFDSFCRRGAARPVSPLARPRHPWRPPLLLPPPPALPAAPPPTPPTRA